ncbi:MAG: bifunctional nuclease family protein [Armatimonadetes bacterium]|nr:bifunctional nuclease family protein [Armatimonadota bacterium]
MSDALCPVQIRGVGLDKLDYDFVLLEDEQGRLLPVWIGRCEAFSIQMRLQRDDLPPRPMTHDLVCQSVAKLGGSITRVLIDDLWQSTYYAKICVAPPNGEEFQVDCRPSDALAVAIRAGVPVLVRDDVLEEGKVPASLPDEPGSEEDEAH